MIWSAILFVLLLFLIEHCYFFIAKKFNIVDKPNYRSLHENVTIRGGGVVFYVAVLIYFVYSNFSFPFFFLGLTFISFISFIDDVKSVPNRVRIVFHALSIALLFYETSLTEIPLWALIIAFVLSVGTLNAYNFMDGINGITGGYSLVFIVALMFLNHETHIVDNQFLVAVGLSLLVFNYFNFRKKAICFAGDAGSVSMAFIVVFLLIKLILATGNIIYILFVALYGVDTVLTIIYRLFNKENIFQAHKSHVFQILVYKFGFSHLRVTLMYMGIQLLLNMTIIMLATQSFRTQLFSSFMLLVLLASIYIYIKKRSMKILL